MRSCGFLQQKRLCFELTPAEIVVHYVNKLNSGFSKLADDEFDNKAMAIYSAISGNPDFPSPSPTPAEVKTLILDYQNALAMPAGQPRDTAVTATRAALATTLDRLARNLELTPGVTDVMLATTGYELRKVPASSGAIVAAPGNVRLKQTGVSGVVQVMSDAVPRASAYELQYTQNPNDGPWTDGGTFASTRGIGITGLTHGKDYWARIRAIGTTGPGPWSDPATILVN